METRLEIKRFPSTLLVIVLALVAAVVLGGALGYTFKPNSVTTAPARVIVVPEGVWTSANEPCVFVDKQKQC